MFTASGMHALSKCGHFLQQWFEWGMFAWVTDDYCYCLLARLGVGFVSFHLNMKMNAFMVRPYSPDTHKGFI